MATMADELDSEVPRILGMGILALLGYVLVSVVWFGDLDVLQAVGFTAAFTVAAYVGTLLRQRREA